MIPNDRKARILVVDDEPALRRVVVRLLRRLGYDVAEVASGEEALAHCREDAPDLVLCDLGLPTMSGLELARRLKEELPGLPVIITSGSPEEEIREQGEVPGIPFLSKPFEIGDLSRVVRETLDWSGGGSEGRNGTHDA